MLLVGLAACAVDGGRMRAGERDEMIRVNLTTASAPEIAALERAFERRNPGHGLCWRPALTALPPAANARVLLVQSGSAAVAGREVEAEREIGVGDAVVVRPGEAIAFSAPIGALEFTLPEAPAAAVPQLIRPDQDPRITDTPGGCATDVGAYRRVLLTWLGENGPYTFHDLNVHRVRIDDSFTHYHPKDGGFDEFYLVQAVRPGARILTSSRTAEIVQPESIARDDVADLLQSTELAVGDLVYLPRGVAHRGLGGVLAQVITVPGFVPGAEIGLDHHLQAINERFGLGGADALPLHAAGAHRAIVR